MQLFDQLFDLTSPDDVKILADRPTVLNSVVVEDRGLVALDREIGGELPVTVINSTGAGGITALAHRALARCRLTAVQSALRDPGDPAGNVARIAAAARELDPDVSVLVDIPDGFGFQDAIAAAEAEGLVAVAGPDTPDRLAARLSAFIEADLPFVADKVGSAVDLIVLLTAVDSLIEEADIDAAAAILAGDDLDHQATAVTEWDGDRTGRVRRRLRWVRTDDLPQLITDLQARGSAI